MKVKSFYGSSIKEALEKARGELGAEATIIASRQLRAEEGRGAGCEVICGLPGSDEIRPAPMAPAPAPVEAPRGRQKSRESNVARIRKGIDAVRTAVTRTQTDELGSDLVRAALASAGLDDDLAGEVVAGVRQRQRQTGTGAERALDVMREELAARLSVSPGLGRSGEERSMVALVGPPGAGKTTTLVKLAVRYGLTARRPLHIITADGGRIGGADSLRTYASAMGVPCDVVETAAALAQLLDSMEGKRLVLVDTPGFGPNDSSASEPLASLLSVRSDIDVQLVLPAGLSPRVLASTVTRFRRFLPSRIIATGADIADSLLPIAALAITLERPVSFVANGQSVPEDLSEASADLLLGRAAQTFAPINRKAGAA